MLHGINEKKKNLILLTCIVYANEDQQENQNYVSHFDGYFVSNPKCVSMRTFNHLTVHIAGYLI